MGKLIAGCSSSVPCASSSSGPLCGSQEEPPPVRPRRRHRVGLAQRASFQHGRLQAGQSVLAHGAAGAVGSMVTQLAREAGAYVIGTGRAADRQKALDFGAQEFVDLEKDALEDIGGVDLVFDVIGGDIGKRSAGLIRAGGTLVTIAGPDRGAARRRLGGRLRCRVRSRPTQ